MHRFILLAIALMSVASCATTPDGEQQLTPEGRTIMETSARIAMRHFIVDSPRAAERIQNIREIIAKLQALSDTQSTLVTLKEAVIVEIKKLNLDPLDEADAMDLLNLFSAALEARLGKETLQADGLVKVNEFLTLLLGLLPATV